MDIDKFPQVADVLKIKHIPKTYMIYKGSLFDQFDGVPHENKVIMKFFRKAEALPK